MSFFAYAFIIPEIFSGKSLFFYPRPRPGIEKVLHSLLPISLHSLLPKVLHPCCQKFCISNCEKLCILNYRLHQRVNDAIKEVAAESEVFKKEVIVNTSEKGLRVSKLVPKYQLITNHTARRSFATNKVLEGYPYSAIMLITGHKTEKAFLRYVKISGYDAIKIFKQHTEKIKIAI